MPPEVKTKEPTLLERLKASRQIAFGKWEEKVSAREKVEADFELRLASETKPSTDEVKAHTDARTAHFSDLDQLEAEVKEWDRRISDQAKVEEARAIAAAAAAAIDDGIGGLRIGDEPLTYMREKAGPHDGHDGISYWRDIAAVGVTGLNLLSTNKADAQERLNHHSAEMRVELPKRMKLKISRAYADIQAAEKEGRAKRGLLGGLEADPFHRGRVDNPFERRVEPNLTQGQGGYFVPPLWLVDQFIKYLRAHIVAAGLPRQLDLPSGTDSINIPKLSTGTIAGYQQANNAGLPSQDWADSVVTANVKTIGGFSDVAIQLLEQSPNQIIDEVVTQDLMAAYNLFKDQQVVAGDGIGTTALNGGHILGLYPSTNWTGTNAITATGSNTPYLTPQIFGAMASQIARTRYDIENFKLLLHGRRWFWYSTGIDGNDRPLGETMGGGRFNIAAALEAGLQAEGLVGTLPYLSDAPVYIDMNVPTTDASGVPGAGTADVAIAALWDDVWLFEGDLRTNVYNEILSASLGVRFQLYNYIAMLVRYGQSLAIASGTAFGTPAGQTLTGLVF